MTLALGYEVDQTEGLMVIYLEDEMDVDTDDDIDPSSDEDIGSLASTVDYDSDVWSTEDISDVEIQSLSRDLLEFPSQMAGEEALEIFNRLLEE